MDRSYVVVVGLPVWILLLLLWLLQDDVGFAPCQGMAPICRRPDPFSPYPYLHPGPIE